MFFRFHVQVRSYSICLFLFALVLRSMHVVTRKDKKVKSFSHFKLFATASMGFSRQEYWSGLPLPSPGDLPDQRIEPGSPALQADTLLSEPPRKLYVVTSIRIFFSFFVAELYSIVYALSLWFTLKWPLRLFLCLGYCE